MKKTNKLKQIIKETIEEVGSFRGNRLSKKTHYNTITWGDLVRAVASNYAEFLPPGGDGEGGIENDVLDLEHYDIEGLFSILNNAGMDTEDSIDFVIKSILK